MIGLLVLSLLCKLRNQGINVNHTGRLLLASMSLAMGLSQEQTCGFFVNAPDYSADTTYLSDKSNFLSGNILLMVVQH